ncbi:Tat twin-arginine translocation pathway signal sequence protein [Nitzschia inconspicua]|uniref:Tat twin-arginine translocation pathway signal sequence protein n=1 Tax=Nitzschia inconspicua TaxID=303405 RepID=A0A9K3PMQ7_9STRA|nr:Tat twin-arginine translocation pathway signal sequence protein [Nitzschia inconspicua]
MTIQFFKHWAIKAWWLLVLHLVHLEALSPNAHDATKISSTIHALEGHYSSPIENSSRRGFMKTSLIGSAALGCGILSSLALPAWAVADCFEDCFKNCKKVAPKDPEYCIENCKDYCAQEDRKDGLSGSVSAERGEVGLLGGTFGQGTVPKGEDRPPSIHIPGLDFTSDAGKKLIGY